MARWKWCLCKRLVWWRSCLFQHLREEYSRLRQQLLQRAKGGRIPAEFEEQQGGQYCWGSVSVEGEQKWERVRWGGRDRSESSRARHLGPSRSCRSANFCSKGKGVLLRSFNWTSNLIWPTFKPRLSVEYMEYRWWHKKKRFLFFKCVALLIWQGCYETQMQKCFKKGTGQWRPKLQLFYTDNRGFKSPGPSCLLWWCVVTPFMRWN